MPRLYKRPADLPEEVRFFHIDTRDSNADLLLKVTAGATKKCIVIPCFVEDLQEFFPNYFGKRFDKAKYQFSEDQLGQHKYYEMEIPYLDDPEDFVCYLRALTDFDDLGSEFNKPFESKFFFFKSFFEK